jgi:hypothetical protein
MGRGLSDLRETIPALAYRNHTSRPLRDPAFRIVPSHPFALDSDPSFSLDLDELGRIYGEWLQRISP